MRLLKYISTAFVVILIGFWVYQTAPHYQIIEGEIFGTFYKIKIKTDIKNKLLQTKIKQRLDTINQQMSVFETQSEISEINRLPKGKRHKLSREMQFVLKAADKVYRQTNGWFDPTLSPLIDLWGFGPGQKHSQPSDKEIAMAMMSVGFNKLYFFDDYRVLMKTNKATKLNLSAIAKGYAVDEIALLLDQEKYQNYVVEIGGEIKTKGFRSDNGDAWTIGLNKPVSNKDENMLVLSLSNMAVATSGNYRNFYEKDGKTYAHTISYKTGRPVSEDALSVSVFHESCMYADAYATAMLAMGVDKALAFAKKYNLAVLVVDNHFATHLSEKAQTFLGEIN